MQEGLQTVRQFLDIELFVISGKTVTLSSIVVFLIIWGVSMVVSRLLQRGIDRALLRRSLMDESTVAVLGRLVHYAVLTIGLAIGLETIGIPLTALFAAGAIFAVGIGIALQGILQNFLSGIILLVERSIKPGDVVETEGQFVRIGSMGIRTTVARTVDEEEIIIPNASLIQATVKNYTLSDSFYRLRARVGVVYGSDMRLVRRTLEEVAEGIEFRNRAREPVVLLREFADSAVVWEVSVWTDNPWAMRGNLSDLNEAIWWALQEAGVVIAFPQLDVHFDPPVVDSLQGLQALQPRSA